MAQAGGYQTGILLESGTNELEVITLYLQWIDPVDKAMHRTAYGINAAKVRELVAMPDELTEVPESHPSVRGVFLLRNRTIPLVDLCHWFRYEPDRTPEARAKWVVVVTEINGKLFSFIAHGVDKVYRVSWNQIMPPPEILAQHSSITGVCLVNNQIIQMVDFEKICADIDPSMAIDAEAHAITMQATGDQAEKAVVIADDSSVIREQITRTLTRAGYKVIPHNDGQAAWEYLEGVRRAGELDRKVLAVITDIEMPRMDGHHLCTKIKAEPAYEKIPVMLFSSLINQTARHKGDAVGADDQITKPELGALVARLQDCLKKKQG